MRFTFVIVFFLISFKTYAQRKTYEYDDLNRLSKARYWEGSVEKYTVTYTYDEVGNRLTKVISGGTCQAPTATLSGTQTIDAGQTAYLTVTFTGGGPYSFVFNGVPYSGITSASYTLPVSPSSTTTYNLTSVSNICGAGTVSGSATITVNPATCTPPQPPSVANVTINSGQTATLTATGCSGTVNWYSMSSGGSSLATGSSFTTPALTATTTYYASCTVNNCVSNTRGSGTVTVNPPTGCDPFEPNNTLTMATVISGDNYTSPDLCLDVTSDEDWFKWSYGGVSYYFQVRLFSSDSQTGKYKLLLTVENGLLTVRTATVDGTITDTYLYMYSADNSLLTSNDDDQVAGGVFSRITYTLPNACTPPQPPTVSSANINSGQTATLTASGCGGTVKWFGTANGGASLNTGTSFTTPALTATTTYYANCIVNGCASTTTGSGTVTVNSNPSGLVFSVKSGSWHDPGTWDCNCVPNKDNDVEVKGSHTVTVSAGDANLRSLKYSGGYLTFQGTRKLCFGCTELMNGLVAYYPFTGSVHDASGNENHGTPRNGVDFATDRFGNARNAMSFDGVDDFIVVDKPFGPFIETTVSVWVKVSNATNDFQALVSSSTLNFVHLQLSETGGISVYTNGGSYVSLPAISQSPLNQWRHIVLTSKSGLSKLFVNGVESGGSVATFTGISPTQTLRIGSGFNDQRFLNGYIDDIRIYDHALTDLQVLQLYNLEK